MNFYKSISKVLSILIIVLLVSCNIEPFEGEIPEDIDDSLPETCQEAALETAEAAQNFANVSPSDSNYAEFCSAYKAALEAQITVCGDQGGTFQSLADALGDCGEDENNNNNNEDGDYWPMSIGNSWTYTQEVTGMANTESTMEITDLVDYKGAPSYLYENFFASAQGTDGTGFENLEVDYYTRKSNGEYAIFVGELSADISGVFRVTQSEYDFIILKDNVDVGTTWDYNFDVTTSYEPLVAGGTPIPNITANYDIKLEIIEKNASVQVAGVTYSPVIKVKYNQKVVIGGLSPQTSTVEYIYSFAKDVGIVKTEGSIFDADDNITSSVNQTLTASTIN